MSDDTLNAVKDVLANLPTGTDIDLMLENFEIDRQGSEKIIEGRASFRIKRAGTDGKRTGSLVLKHDGNEVLRLKIDRNHNINIENATILWFLKRPPLIRAILRARRMLRRRNTRTRVRISKKILKSIFSSNPG